jgi:hypothetical protein
VDAFRHEYNTDRPHQSLDMAFPVDRFRPNTTPDDGEDPVGLRLPTLIADAVADIDGQPVCSPPTELAPPRAAATPVVAAAVYEPGGAVEFERVVPPSGNLQVCRKQFWLGPIRSGLTVTFWADPDVIHLLIGGVRIKSLRSHLSVTDLAGLLRDGGRPAGPSPLPQAPFTGAVEVDRTVSSLGQVCLGQHIVLAAEILAGRRVSIRVDEHTLTFFDPDSRDLLRTRRNPLSPAEIAKLRSARPAGPPPQPPTGPIRVQRRASNSGVVMVAGQKVSLGRANAHTTVAIDVTDTELHVDCAGTIRTFRRTTDLAVHSIKAHRPRKTEPAAARKATNR